jgi:hypothetical protein
MKFFKKHIVDLWGTAYDNVCNKKDCRKLDVYAEYSKISCEHFTKNKELAKELYLKYNCCYILRELHEFEIDLWCNYNFLFNGQYFYLDYKMNITSKADWDTKLNVIDYIPVLFTTSNKEEFREAALEHMEYIKNV